MKLGKAVEAPSSKQVAMYRRRLKVEKKANILQPRHKLRPDLIKLKYPFG